jgi:hypothetical protein
MVALARFFDWRSALAIVKPATFLRWHRNAFRLFWRWKSRRRGRPSLPPNLRGIIRRFGLENPTWGEERIADELLVKFGIRVSPRTVSKYLGSGRPHVGRGDLRWATFVRNYSKAIVACDFFVAVSATLSLRNKQMNLNPSNARRARGCSLLFSVNSTRKGIRFPHTPRTVESGTSSAWLPDGKSRVGAGPASAAGPPYGNEHPLP